MHGSGVSRACSSRGDKYEWHPWKETFNIGWPIRILNLQKKLKTKPNQTKQNKTKKEGGFIKGLFVLLCIALLFNINFKSIWHPLKVVPKAHALHYPT